MSGLFAELFPPITEGWARGAARYGDTQAPAKWATVNSWLYYGPPDAVDPDPALEGVKERARAEAWWRDEVRRWNDDERPAVVAVNRSLQSEDPASMDEPALADHLRRAFRQYAEAGPLHFEHAGNHVCNDVLRAEAAAAGFPDVDVGALAVGSSPATARPARLVAAITDALVAAGVSDGRRLSTLADVRDVSPSVAARLDDYLDEYGWRLVDSYDPSFPVLLERPRLVLAAIEACLAQRWRRGAAAEPVAPWGARGAHPRLDALLADARALHAMRDDDDGTCFFWPMGLIRRAVLEAGRRLVAEGRLVAVTDLFEATTGEILGLLEGASSPDSAELSRRAEARVAAGEVTPPPMLGGAAPAAAAAAAAADVGVGRLTGTPIGTGVGIGRARVHRSGDDVLGAIEPGDVLVTMTTTPAFNTVFPLLAGVICEVGSLRSHAALLSRELGVPAVVGVAGALSTIPDGASVEVDGDTGVCTIL